mgnify:CR=1 FL=1
MLESDSMRGLWLLILVFVFSGCGYFQNETSEQKAESKWPEDRLYRAAKDRLDGGECSGAIEYYEKLSARYPFGIYTQQSQLELAYCYYRTEDPEQALSTIDRFMKMHPSHPHAAYAYYLRGLINFGRGYGLTERFLPKDPSQRDPGASLQSFNDFSDLISSFPESIYVEDATLRMRYLRNILAQHEVNVANWYMRRGAFVAAANRARYVVENYQQAPAMPDALFLMAKSYRVLELEELAEDALRILELNYPGHPGIQHVQEVTVKE